MSVQQSFYALDADVWSLFEAPGPRAFRAVEGLTPSPRGLPLMEIWPTFIAYILPPGADADEVVWRDLGARGGRVVAEHSPVVELSVATAGVTLAPSRIWLGATQITPFRREAMLLFKGLQRRIVAWPRALPSGYPVGPAAAAEVRAGALRLVDGIVEQRL